MSRIPRIPSPAGGNSYLSSTPLPTTPTTISSASILHNRPSSHRPSSYRATPNLDTTLPLSADRPERLWYEMQQKLSEVELSNTPIFFGTSHARALEELRVAQIGLAQAWMAGGVDEMITATTAAAAAAGGNGGGGSGIGVAAGMPGKGDETDVEMIQAKKRRAANDAHFERVARGVSEVAGKLDAAAVAMRGVERQSRGIWDSGSSSEEDEGSDMA